MHEAIIVSCWPVHRVLAPRAPPVGFWGTCLPPRGPLSPGPRRAGGRTPVGSPAAPGGCSDVPGGSLIQGGAVGASAGRSPPGAGTLGGCILLLLLLLLLRPFAGLGRANRPVRPAASGGTVLGGSCAGSCIRRCFAGSLIPGPSPAQTFEAGHPPPGLAPALCWLGVVQRASLHRATLFMKVACRWSRLVGDLNL